MAQPHPRADARDGHHPAEDVRHRQEQQYRRLLLRPFPEDGVEKFDGVVDLGEEVAVGERAALRTAGRARGVDERGEGVGAQHPTAYGDFLVRYVLAELREPLDVPLLEDPHVLEVGDAVAFRAQGGGLGEGLRGEGHRAGVLEDPAGLEGGGRRVDGYGHQTRRPRGEVHERPLVRRPRHDGQPVARLQALGDQPLGHREDLLGELGRRDVLPVPVRRTAAEGCRLGVLVRVVEGDVRERAVGRGRDERRYGHLPHGPVQSSDLGLDQERLAVVSDGGHDPLRGRGGRRGRERRRHERLLWRAAAFRWACTSGGFTTDVRIRRRRCSDTGSYGSHVWGSCGFGGGGAAAVCKLSRHTGYQWVTLPRPEPFSR